MFPKLGSNFANFVGDRGGRVCNDYVRFQKRGRSYDQVWLTLALASSILNSAAEAARLSSAYQFSICVFDSHSSHLFAWLQAIRQPPARHAKDSQTNGMVGYLKRLREIRYNDEISLRLYTNYGYLWSKRSSPYRYT